MNILRLSTLLLFTTMLIPIGVSAHCKGKHGPGHPHCDPGDPPDPGGSNVYTATLTGAFEFTRDVTLNSKENQLKSELPITIDRPESPDPFLPDPFLAVWNNVFEHCPNFFGSSMVDVPGFTAPAGKKGWTIDKPGGVRVNFRTTFDENDFGGSLSVESAWVSLALIGDIPFEDDFPPVGPIPLSHFQIHGQTEAGVTPRFACDDANFETEDLIAPAPIILTLTIKEP